MNSPCAAPLSPGCECGSARLSCTAFAEKPQAVLLSMPRATSPSWTNFARATVGPSSAFPADVLARGPACAFPPDEPPPNHQGMVRIHQDPIAPFRSNRFGLVTGS